MEELGALLNEYKLYFVLGAVAAGAVWAWIRLRKSARQTEMRQSSGTQSTNLQAGRDITMGSGKDRK